MGHCSGSALCSSCVSHTRLVIILVALYVAVASTMLDGSMFWLQWHQPYSIDHYSGSTLHSSDVSHTRWVIVLVAYYVAVASAIFWMGHCSGSALCSSGVSHSG